jgi:BirA family biotin operon repressor/biotin-[acetyl-CoA-carboxylase] ligase
MTVMADGLLLDGEALRLRGSEARVGRRVLCHREVASTSAVAAALAASGEREGTVVLAERQTAGRGRFGRAWASPPGLGLWFSTILRPPIPVAGAPVLTQVAAVAVAEGIEEVAGPLPGGIKWPNDVFLAGRKVAGILTELVDRGDAGVVILGVGVNVNQGPADFPAALGGKPGSVAMAAGKAVPRADLFRALLRRLDSRYREFLAAGPAAALAEAAARSLTLGHPVRAREGEAELSGVAFRLEADGALALRLQNGQLRRLVAGEVTLLLET